MKTIVLLLLPVFITVHTVTAQQATVIDSLVTCYTGNAEFNGTVLVAVKGKLLLQKGYGYSNAAAQTPNNEHTVFNIASITKTFTAALVLKLQEQGKLSVTDTLGKYYPGYPNGGKVTIHQLLTHTSGIHDYLATKEFQLVDQTQPRTLDSLIIFFKNKPFDFAPGTRFQYSNAGYTLLGGIIEKVTGMPYGAALEQYIFKPLHLDNTSYGPPADTAALATGYTMYYKNFKRTSFVVNPSISYATGAIYSTTDDLYKWAQALQQGRFLNSESWQQAYKKDKGPYGYGWFTDSLYGRQRVSHDGNIPGFKSNINCFPGDGVYVIALGNSNNSAVGGMVRNIVNILYHQPLAPAFENLPAVTIPDSLKADYAGLYKFTKADTAYLNISYHNHALFIAVNAGTEAELVPIGRDVFRSSKMRIEFKRSNTGKIVMLLLFKEGEIAQSFKQE